MAIILKNQTGSARAYPEFNGIVLPAYTGPGTGTLDIEPMFPDMEFMRRYPGSSLATDVAAGNVIINDGANDLTNTQLNDMLNAIEKSEAGASLHSDVAGEVNALTSKGTPVSGDVILIEDSADSYNKKKTTIGSLPVGFPELHSFLGTTSDPGDAVYTVTCISAGQWYDFSTPPAAPSLVFTPTAGVYEVSVNLIYGSGAAAKVVGVQALLDGVIINAQSHKADLAYTNATYPGWLTFSARIKLTLSATQHTIKLQAIHDTNNGVAAIKRVYITARRVA